MVRVVTLRVDLMNRISWKYMARERPRRSNRTRTIQPNSAESRTANPVLTPPSSTVSPFVRIRCPPGWFKMILLSPARYIPKMPTSDIAEAELTLPSRIIDTVSARGRIRCKNRPGDGITSNDEAAQ
eukprot:gb/GECG01006152.1/.p1 GENE.gb/GECG01006152.1/~~gb/GECG01006152.1/.p1  ORF type:complete len:127 (+),score=6.36 gb/GECG01006152.1/:1-381(+)